MPNSIPHDKVHGASENIPSLLLAVVDKGLTWQIASLLLPPSKAPPAPSYDVSLLQLHDTAALLVPSHHETSF